MITQEQLKELLDYNSSTGIFVWKKTNSNRSKAGNVAGYKNSNGYIVITVCKRKLLAHRLAWLYVYGATPTNFIDHINGIRSDNRIENIRDVTCATNSENVKSAYKNNKTGFMGVVYRKGKYDATLMVSGKQIYLGGFSSPEDANAAYLHAKRRMHNGCTI